MSHGNVYEAICVFISKQNAVPFTMLHKGSVQQLPGIKWWIKLKKLMHHYVFTSNCVTFSQNLIFCMPFSS